ncbi:lamin tail domain-containing protein [Winogradskyella sp.]|uniref:lamin tail domain-containing protein n=1 Tax=Winogradskyella sp. TaxID=1883156 RepID=UPI002622432A|nr:lamin tail domain-containing protein [Winogradskyella sp.]
MKKLYILFLLSSFIGFSQNPGDLVITEYLNDSDAVSDTVGEWFEIYNTTGSAIDLDGWTIRDDGSDSYTFSATLLVPANSYFVLGRGPNDPSNGGVSLDFSYGDGVFTLGNGDDEIVLVSPTDVEIDRVNYGSGNGFPDEGPGTSLILDPTLTIATADNNDGSNWCFSSSSFGGGDLGTPGAQNDTCTATCEANLGASNATCDTINPGATDDTYTVTLAYTGAATGEMFVVSTSPTGFTIGGDDPTAVADGTITISGVTEGTDITITVDNTADGGLCTLTRDITTPVCIPTGSVDLELQGVIDFTVPEGGSAGKAVHVVATANIADLSEYSIAVVSNGGGTYGASFDFPSISVSTGEHILLARDLTAMENYFTTAGYNLFDYQILATSSVTQNGDDTIGLFKNGSLVEEMGDPNVDGTGESWEYLDSWAYKNTPGSTWPMGWIYGSVNCTDGSNTIFDSSCVYPFVASLSNTELTRDELSIYPNPVNSGVINITSAIEGVKSIQLFDIMGRNVISTAITSNTLDVSNLRTGIYLLKVTIADRTSTTKLIIE